MYKKTVLDNGLRIITVPLKNAQTVTVMVLVGTGSEHESKQENGISHFLEHMLFQGTRKRPNQLEIAKALDSVGGLYNAFTDKEVTGYWAKVDLNNLELAFDWVSDIFLNSKIESKNIEKEKGVIIEELNMYMDDPSSHAWFLFDKLLYGDQAAGRSGLGTKKSISSFQKKHFSDYLKYYGSQNAVICVAGDVDPKTIKKLTLKYFKTIKKGKIQSKKAVIENQKQPNIKLHYKKTDQSHLYLGVRANNSKSSEKYAQSLLVMILGKMMSSRLFISLRGQGLVYSTKTYNDLATNRGVLVTYAGTDNQRVEKTIKLILKEYKDIKKNGINKEELKKAKEFFKGRARLSMESSNYWTNLVAMQELLYGELLTPKQIFDKIDKVTVKDIQRVANDIFVPEKLNLALIGPFKDKKRFEKLLKI